MSLTDLSALEIAETVRSGRLAATDVLAAFRARIEEWNERLGAFARIEGEAADRAAREVDRRVARGDDPGPLAGVPLAVKDNLAVADRPLGCGSRILDGVVARHEAPAVTRAREAGAVLVGATNLDEFGMGSSGETSAFGPGRNPWDLERVPGGSSAGSAIAVAARLVPLALGSDTGGSIRQPAALCGVVGMRPTYGRVSRRGLVAFASSLDQIGPMARTVREAATLLRVICGADPLDATAVDRAAPETPAEGPLRLGGVRLGVPPDEDLGALDDEVREHFEAGLDSFRSLGAEIVAVSFPTSRAALPAYYLLAAAEASSNLARYDGIRFGPRERGDDPEEITRRTRDRFGPEVKRRLLLGAHALSEGRRDDLYERALRVRVRLRTEMRAALSKVEAILTPTSPVPAFPLGERRDDPVRMYAADALTVPASLAGLPAVSVPGGFTDGGLPVGMQIACDHGGDEGALVLAASFEDVTGFHRLVPGAVR